MPHPIALVTDSTCDIPGTLRAQYEIGSAPCYIIWGDQMLRDGIDITHEQFYERLTRDPVHPTTSQPSPQDFLSCFQDARAQGAREIVCIVLSGALSGGYSSAMQAVQMVDFPVHVYDSKGTSMSLGWQVLAAARAREAGGSAQDMLAVADAARRRMVFIVMLDTLEYLHKGGRVGGATRFIGAALNFKPQIYVNHETGLVEPGERTRTREKSLQALYNGFFKRLPPGKRLYLAAIYTTDRTSIDALAERARQEYHPVEIVTESAAPVLGVHAGPGAAAFCGYTEE